VRLARLAIWLATAGFIFMLFYPLVVELVMRFGAHSDSGVP
jgi:hypothetical protein